MARIRQLLSFATALVLALAAIADLASADDKKEKSISVVSPDNMVGVVAQGNVIEASDLKTGRILFRIKNSDTVTALTFTPDGKVLIAGGKDATIHLLDRTTGKAIRVMKGHKAAIATLAVSGDGRSLTSQSTDKKTLVWDLATGKIIPQK